MPEAKNALEHSERRVHHLTMGEHHQGAYDKAKKEDVKEKHQVALKAHREAQAAHSSAEHHILMRLQKNHPEMFSSPTEKPRQFSSVEEAKKKSAEISEKARLASIEADGGKRYVGPHAKFKNGYPEI